MEFHAGKIFRETAGDALVGGPPDGAGHVEDPADLLKSRARGEGAMDPVPDLGAG